jgi:NAD(P)-dependent dehydrogenase (short-subunit alcohol dehydrogenase family)
MGYLDGKVAIVTGAGRGIGRGEALMLAAEGAAVVVNDLGSSNDGQGEDIGPAADVVAEIAAAGGRAVVDGSDISTWAGGETVVKRALAEFGRLDILVCNAGIVRDRMIFKMAESEWDAVIAVHLKGHVSPTRFAGEHWRRVAKETGKPSGGRIVYTSSHVGLFGNVGQTNYAAAKAGIALLGVAVARELAPYGVTVNSICPGAKTRLVEATFPGFGDPPAEGFDPMHPDNVGPFVAYLCSDSAAHISGQTFGVTGGYVELLQGWSSVASIDKGDRWTVDELIDRVPEVFGDRPTGPSANLFDH